MKRHSTISILCLLVMLTGSAGILAQERQAEKTPSQSDARGFPGPRGGRGANQGPRRPFPPDATFDFVGSEMRFGGKTVKGAPYSAIATIETVQTLQDGTRISHKTMASVYRDGEGRTRREHTLGAIGPFAATGEAPQMIHIQDPVAGAQYVLDPRTHTARKMKTWSGPPPEQQRSSSPTAARTESLGKQTFEGVEAEGTRSTLTIAAGQIGNDRPIEIVSERWYSSALDVVVFSKHSDPRMGEHIYRLTNINRAEPARSLFELPADYTVDEPRRPDGARMRGMRKFSGN
ncbi:MAG TPA: hypothetical protein VGV87_20830 [Blastocatellia bacterium]|nr:hypothetical protein [Blastocatellia bacterium]